jgi:hypothetical protein
MEATVDARRWLPTARLNHRPPRKRSGYRPRNSVVGLGTSAFRSAVIRNERGGSSSARLFSHTLERLRQPMLSHGAAEDDINDTQRLSSDCLPCFPESGRPEEAPLRHHAAQDAKRRPCDVDSVLGWTTWCGDQHTQASAASAATPPERLRRELWIGLAATGTLARPEPASFRRRDFAVAAPNAPLRAGSATRRPGEGLRAELRSLQHEDCTLVSVSEEALVGGPRLDQ